MFVIKDWTAITQQALIERPTINYYTEVIDHARLTVSRLRVRSRETLLI